MKLLKLFASTAHITYNKYIAKELGVDEAILFGELCSKYEQFTDGELESNNDEFYCLQEQLIEDTCLTDYRIRNALKTLQESGWLIITKKGIPAKNWYKLNEQKIIELTNVQRTSGTKFNRTGDDKFNSTTDDNFNSTIYNKKEINKKINNKKENICVKPKNSKKDKIIKQVEKKCLEYDLTDNVIDLVIEFYTVLLENNKMISNQKIDADLGNIAKANVSIQIKTIKTALERGWQSLNTEWVQDKTFNNKNTLINHEQTVADKHNNNHKF